MSSFISAIVLSAGESRRMGTQKVLLPYRGTTIIEHIVQGALPTVDEVVVVLGHQPAPVAQALTPYPVRVVQHPQYKMGMLSSIRAGMQALDPRADAFALLLGDQPQLLPEVLEMLVRRYRENPTGMLLPVHAGRRGHPPIISLQYRAEILAEFDDMGLRGLYRRYPEEIATLEVGERGICADMDTPEDYQHLLRRRL